MNILVINSGSSSIKFQLIQMPSEAVISSGMVDRIGNQDASVKLSHKDFNHQEVLPINTHAEGLQQITNFLLDPVTGPLEKIEDIHAVGHRVVHGGNSFSDTCIIDTEVKLKIEQYAIMAPLHNPPNLKGILVTEEQFPAAVQVAVFDTAFHQTIPVMAHKYAIPNEYYDKYELKAYGFHGTSHSYVVQRAREFLPENSARIISVHLGNGCSITAVHNGKSVDTSLGFGPSNGLIMGTRSGDIDHSLILYMVKTLGYSLEDIKSILDKKSGMLGLTGHSDLREIEALAEKGNKDARLALSMYAYRIKKYIGGYTAAMNGLDALIFTAGVGENSSSVRTMVCQDMDYLGIELNNEKNIARSEDIRLIDSGELEVRILVVPTNEELEIARQAYHLLVGK